jgi:DNA-binding response OmpR family regulator
LLSTLSAQTELRVAANGMEAQHWLLAEPIDGVLCDAVLDDMSAAQLCVWLRLIPAAPYVYFGVLYESKQRAEALTAMGAGADDSIELELSTAALLASLPRIQRVLQSHRRIETLRTGRTEKVSLAMLPRAGSSVQNRPSELSVAAPAAAPSPAQPLNAPKPAPLPSLHILCVDDEPLYPELVRLVAEKLGHRCTVAHDGRQGFQLASQSRFDIIISDWMMPHLTGPELCRRVRTLPGASPYFILLTTLYGTENYLEASQVGVDNYLTKPIEPAKVELALLAAQRAVSAT